MWPLLLALLCSAAAHGLRCYSCNIISGSRSIDEGCTSPEPVTCSQSHQGFKQRFCIRTESVVLGKLLTSGCATSRHCHQHELPGVRIRCCDTDLCNGATLPTTHRLHLLLGLVWIIFLLYNL
ncbi:hypothetical protein GDO81_027205 [Engystomops pustulosus]|uniref:Uncharacterized protein n=1 Tax=Engystomops pustulosus TaxID=76066 RepID=A0AAV6YM55_ENGPU|nr:hypothetical protein GDO81_027205 [Engystomops pustulosus]